MFCISKDALKLMIFFYKYQIFCMKHINYNSEEKNLMIFNDGLLN